MQYRLPSGQEVCFQHWTEMASACWRSLAGSPAGQQDRCRLGRKIPQQHLLCTLPAPAHKSDMLTQDCQIVRCSRVYRGPVHLCRGLCTCAGMLVWACDLTQRQSACQLSTVLQTGVIWGLVGCAWQTCRCQFRSRTLVGCRSRSVTNMCVWAGACKWRSASRALAACSCIYGCFCCSLFSCKFNSSCPAPAGSPAKVQAVTWLGFPLLTWWHRLC
jgi:hypothetical protein